MRLLLLSVVFFAVFLATTSLDPLLEIKYLKRDHIKCTAEQVLRNALRGCEEIVGNIVIQGRSFTDTAQSRFHSVRLIRGKVEIDAVPNLTNLTAFKNVWDIEYLNTNLMAENSNLTFAFSVINNKKLKEICLDNLVSLETKYEKGFLIRNNGNYRMPLKQKEALHEMIVNRNLLTDIDFEQDKGEVQLGVVSKTMAIGAGLLFLIGSFLIGGILIHFCTLANRSSDTLEYFEDLLNDAGDESKEGYDQGFKRIKGMGKIVPKKNQFDRKPIFDE